MSIAAKCSCGKSLTYCVSGCPYEQVLPDLGLHIVEKPVIDWDAIEKEYALTEGSWAAFNWIKEQVSKYI